MKKISFIAILLLILINCFSFSITAFASPFDVLESENSPKSYYQFVKKTLQKKEVKSPQIKESLVEYSGPIEHLFTHCLISYPKIAFNKDNFMRSDYDKDCLTPIEFKRVLSSLYKKDYVLIKMSDTYKIVNGKAEKKKIYLPKGKKPLIFSFDDVNYAVKKMNHGMVDKIILDKDGNIATYTQNANKKISYNKEFVTILENFIKNNPNFSFNGAKGLICLTGFDGILGYRTDLTSPNRQSEIAAVKPVIAKLKQLGWEFASHSYGHYHMKHLSLQSFKNDVNRWKNEVESLIGKTEVYVYPYGEYEITDNAGNVSKKHKLLKEAGFVMFCGVGSKYFYGMAPFNTSLKNRILFMDRRPIDGFDLRNRQQIYNKFFNCYNVYDKQNRFIPIKKEVY